MPEFKVIICGSRDFTDYELLKSKCDLLLSKKIEDGYKITIVSGCAKGADTLGEKYSSERNFNIERYPADWTKYGKGAGFIRNGQMALNAHACIAFFSSKNESNGTKDMVNKALKEKLLVRKVYQDDEKKE